MRPKLLQTMCLIVGAAIALVGTTGSAEACGPKSPSTGSKPPASAKLGPVVTHTKKGPTGYVVTFRFYDPTAKSVRIKGEWSFASAVDIAADPTNPNPRFGSTWRPGDIPIPSPLAGSAGNWPVNDLVKDSTGVWTYTTPLPSGVFSYAFYTDCDAAAPAMSGCTALADPANPPWSSAGSAERTSQVYVPSDSKFGTTDYSWQAPVARGKSGTLQHLAFSLPGHANPVDQNYVTVYTPAGYNAKRAVPYPTYYLNHGGGGSEMNWSTQGAMSAILDNLIADKLMQPAVVVMPNNPGTAEILDYLVPFIEGRFNVSAKPADRALSGLSGGGTVVQDILYHHTTEFGYYGVWSVPRGLPTEGEEANPELKQLLGLHVGVGIQDLGGNAQGTTTAAQALLTSAGVPFVSYNVDGAHTWSYWRDALRDFLTRVAFRSTKVSLATHGCTATATVKADTSQTTKPTGTVRFYLDGKAIGAPQKVKNGAASAPLPAKVGKGELTAKYSCDARYNSSSATLKVKSQSGGCHQPPSKGHSPCMGQKPGKPGHCH